MANQLRQKYDIIINGGGLVGFTLLKLIQKSPQLNRCKVLLIEQAPKPSSLTQPRRSLDSTANTVSDHTDYSTEPIFSNRVSSITQKSKKILKTLGVWTNIERYAKDVKSIKVWNYNYMDKMVFDQIEAGRANVMFSVVENNRLSLGLLNSIYKDNVDAIRWNNNLVKIEIPQSSNSIQITTKDNKTEELFTASAPLLLGCDGFMSKVRELSSMKYNEIKLDKVAVVGTVKVEIDFMNPNSQINDIAFQRFSPGKDTVAALLPLNEKYSSFVISAPTYYAKQLMDCDDDSFVDEFNRLLMDNECPDNIVLQRFHVLSNIAAKTIESFLSRIPLSQSINYSERTSNNIGPDVDPPRVTSVVQKSRASFPLLFGSTTPRMISTIGGRQNPQIALVGDSSHRVHPLAGQGLNLGIQDANELVEQLEFISRRGERVFDENDLSLLAKALRRYEIKRQGYIVPMSIGILSMPYLFKLAPPSAISTFDKISVLKRASVKFANGM